MSDRTKKPTQRGHTGSDDPAPFEDDAPTTVDPERRFQRAPSPPIQVVSVKAQDDSGPIAISMKTPYAQAVVPEESSATPVVPRPKLRAMSEITALPHAQRNNLGYLAPPRDPAEVRSRRVHDLVIWASVAVILASAVALVIWFLAR